MVFGVASIAFSEPGAAGGTSDSDSAVDPWSDVEEFVIYGKASAALINETSSFVTSFDAAELQAIGVEDVGDVAAFTPNLEIRKVSSSSATFFIRGVGLNDFTANGSGAVAIYQDDVALNLPPFQLGQLFDTENVTIEKGPIGTGPGRNASAGAIRVFSKKPTGVFEAALRTDFGNYGYVDTEGALEIPIYEEQLSARMAFRLTKRDGLVENRCGGLSREQIDAANGSPCSNNVPNSGVRFVVPGLERDLNDIDKWAARGILRFQPEALDMDWVLNLHGSRLDQTGTVGQNIGTSGERLGGQDASGYQQPEIFSEQTEIFSRFPTPPGATVCRPPPRFDPVACDLRNTILAARSDALGEKLAERPLDREPFAGDYNLPGYERLETFGGSLRGDWAIDGITLTSVTGAERYRRERLIDADFSPNRLFEFDTRDDAYQITQDLRASGDLESIPATWEVGGFTLIEELDFEQVTLAGPGVFKIDEIWTQETESFGLYALVSWDFLDGFTLEGGARYNWERKRLDAEVFVQDRDACRPPGGQIPPDCVEVQTFDAPTGTVKLIYQLSADSSVYWKYNHGWKGPQYNVRDGTLLGEVIDIAEPETIDAFEVGFDGAWFEGRLTLEAALFWYDYQDYQVFQFVNDVGVPPQRIVLNANEAQIYGFELDGQIEPLENLIFDFRLGWLESKFLDFTDTGAREVPGSDPFSTVIFRQTVDYTGNRLPNTPRFKASLSVRYTFESARLGSLTPRYDLSWTDDVYFDSSEGRGAPSLTANAPVLPDYTIGQKAYALHHVRLTYRAPSGGLEISGWVRNLTNEVYKTLSFDASQSTNLVANLVGEPRTYGVSIGLSF